MQKPSFAPPEQLEFLRKQSPHATYVMSVCGGSIILAEAGALNGKRATTNKSLFTYATVCFYNFLSICFLLYFYVFIYY